MFPLGLVLGAAAGATAALMLGPQIASRGRPLAKAALKAALLAMHEARVQQALIVEAAEDLFAEAKAEATAEVFAAAMAAAQAKAAEQAKAGAGAAPSPSASSARAKAARRRAPVKRSRLVTPPHD
jgi:hypothetical protein